MRELMAITKALADEQRVRILLALQQGELCVCQIVELLDLAPSTVSKHLSILHHAGLIQSRKDERWVHYRLPGRVASAPVREALAWVRKSFRNTPQANEDLKRLKRLLRVNLKTICQRQNRR